VINKEFKFRLATISDANILLKWRNDPETRKWSHTTEVIKKKEHIQWMTDSLKNSNRNIYIVEYKKHPVGTVRTDEKDGVIELSWTVAPEARGHGIGKEMVALFVKKIKSPIIAEIKIGNEASKRIAEYAGMRFSYEKDGILYYQ
jgi:RimJ/RimL family protein N-acetyltransferase